MSGNSFRQHQTTSDNIRQHQTTSSQHPRQIQIQHLDTEPTAPMPETRPEHRITIRYCTQCKWMLRAAYVCLPSPFKVREEKKKANPPSSPKNSCRRSGRIWMKWPCDLSREGCLPFRLGGARVNRQRPQEIKSYGIGKQMGDSLVR